jgi:hypothetical protein
MRSAFLAVLLAGGVLTLGAANAADGCGPGCHSAPYGGCVVDGWGNASTAPVLNECPVGTRPRPPCPIGYIWRYGACFLH